MSARGPICLTDDCEIEAHFQRGKRSQPGGYPLFSKPLARNTDPRMKPLEKLGVVRRSGTRRAYTGRQQIA